MYLEHSYRYDELNRLVSANGKAKGAAYDLVMRYDVMGNPLLKHQRLDGCETSAVGDSMAYEYADAAHPNAVSRAGSRLYRYDACGNPVEVEDTVANRLRVMQWDEDNRLMTLGDDGYVSRYTYSHSGERAVKSHGPTTTAFVNGAPQGVQYHDKDNWTAYVSPYMVVGADRFTKHYYAGTQRIASKIGVGVFSNLYGSGGSCVTAGQKDYAARMELIAQTRTDQYVAMGVPPGPPTSKGIYGEAEYTGLYDDYQCDELKGDYSVPSGWPQHHALNLCSGRKKREQYTIHSNITLSRSTLPPHNGVSTKVCV